MPEQPIRPMKRQSNVVTLPPAGHAQREEMKQRTEQLAEKIEAQPKNEVAFDAATFEPDWEILHNLDGLAVTEAQPGFTYKWVRYTSQFNQGLAVKQAAAFGWKTVNGDDPEAIEYKIVGGLRQIGDVVLMKIPTKLHERWEKRNAELNKAREAAGVSNLAELGRQKGVIVKETNTDPDLLKKMDARHRGTLAAEQKFDFALRTGEIVGIQ